MIGVIKSRNNSYGYKNNDSGASAIPQSVDFRTFAINVKTIVPTQKCMKIWTRNMMGRYAMAVYSFLEEYDFGAKTIILFITHGGSGASRTVDAISEPQPGALMIGTEWCEAVSNEE